MRTAVTSAGGAVTQPIFQPVTENVLPALPIVTVRSAMPGSVAIGMCARPSKVRCSYTSSDDDDEVVLDRGRRDDRQLVRA